MKHLKTQEEVRAYCRYHNAMNHLHHVLMKNNPTHEEFDRAYHTWREASQDYQSLVDRIKQEDENRK